MKLTRQQSLEMRQSLFPGEAPVASSSHARNGENSRMTVTSPKTAYQGKASRIIPIFPELLPHLRESFEAAEPGTEYVVTRYRSGSANLRIQLTRIIRRAGLEPGEKLLHNLRASRETRLCEQFPLHVVCGWIGNTSTIAARRYLQTTDAHFERAIAGDGNEPEKVTPKAAQIPAQYMHVNSRKVPYVEGQDTGEPPIYGYLRGFTASYATLTLPV